MNSKLPRILILGVGIGMILASLVLGLLRFHHYQSIQNVFPEGLTMAGIPVGGVSRDEAIRRIETAYQIPIEIRYQGAVIHVTPQDLGFTLDIDAMLKDADQTTLREGSRINFWDTLWNQVSSSHAEIPLQASIDPNKIRQYLVTIISPRYDQPAVASRPDPSSLLFLPGEGGQSLDVDAAIPLIEAALKSMDRRVVALTAIQTPAPLPSVKNLQLAIQQTIDRAGFDGLVEIYLKSIADQTQLHFAYQNKANPAVDIAFTAASTIKIPIMVSVYRRIDYPPSDDILQLLTLMITQSKNDPADRLMETVLDPVRGPLIVTEDMQALGFQNTFLAGYFYMGAPLLNIYETPGNTRADIHLEPDIYNQTSPREMGTLLEDVYLCAEQNSGPLLTAFNGEVTRDECRQIINLLSNNKLPYLITAGIPEGVQIAHKHGWIEESDGLLHTMSDSGIIFSPGGDFVLTIYMYHPDQLVFDDGNALIADISKVIYSFFNPSR